VPIIDSRAAMAFIATGQAIRAKYSAPDSLMAGTTFSDRGPKRGFVNIAPPKNRKARRKAASLSR
jgi:hypothetical protein